MKGKAIVVLLVALLAGAGGFWGARELERRRCAAEKAELEAVQSQALRVVRAAAETWAEAISRRQAEAVLRAFVSGISPSIQTDRRESLAISSTSLLRVPGVEGIHLLRPDGEILYSSNVKMTTTGELGEAGSWALRAPELVSRSGARQGSLDLAVPLVDAGQVLAVVWMEYGLDAVRDLGRPSELTRAGSPPLDPPPALGGPAAREPASAEPAAPRAVAPEETSTPAPSEASAAEPTATPSPGEGI